RNDQRGHDEDCEDTAEKTQSHCRPPACGCARGCGGRVSSPSGRYGTTPVPPEFESRMILSVPPRTRSMVSRYMRSRVTAGAFLYCSYIFKKRDVWPVASATVCDL